MSYIPSDVAERVWKDWEGILGKRLSPWLLDAYTISGFFFIVVVVTLAHEVPNVFSLIVNKLGPYAGRLLVVAVLLIAGLVAHKFSK